jgi:tubulin polyglutamylase TTLL6/13
MIIKTIVAGQPTLNYFYKSCLPEDVENQYCFQILGFDIMIDKKLKPWLLEVNHAPSLATDSAFDMKVKKKLVEDTIRILNLSRKRKIQY